MLLQRVLIVQSGPPELGSIRVVKAQIIVSSLYLGFGKNYPFCESEDGQCCFYCE